MRSWLLDFSGPCYWSVQSKTARCGRIPYGAVKNYTVQSQNLNMWAKYLQKWQNDGESITNPPQFVVIGYQSPRPAKSTGGQPRPNQPGANQPAPIAANPRQSPLANRANPSKPRGQPIGPTNPAQSIPGQLHGPTKRANQSHGAKPPPKQSPNHWGPINPQTGQTTNPGQSPVNPKQPLKRAFEVSAHLLSKAKKTPVLPGVVLVLRQFPIVVNVKL
jgi:hypothetical protein